MDFWEEDSLESITSHFGRLLKIDEYTTTFSRSKFAWVYVEIELAKPLKQSFWLGEDNHRVFVVVLYEKLPTFYYICGLVGQGSNNCSCRHLETPDGPPPPLVMSQMASRGWRSRSL